MNKLILSLRDSLGDCKRIESSVCLRKTSYEIVNNRIFYVYDNTKDEHPIKVVDKMHDYQLTVNNHNKYDNDVCILKTDKCLLTDKHQKCDCIIFNRNKLFFVEISESRQKGNKRRNAVDQIESTISILRKSNINIERFEVAAIICFKNGKSRPTQASFNANRDAFLERNGIVLDETNEISF